MKLDQLLYFLELARTEHVGRAARRLHISPSAVSHAVQALEEELGAELFVRDGRRLAINDRGRRLAERVAAIAAAVDSLKADALQDGHDGQPGLRGKARFGAPHSLAADCLAPAWARLTRRHPGLDGTLTSLGSRQMVEQLVEGHLDFGMGFEIRGEARLEQTLVHEGRLVFCVRKGHALAALAPDALLAAMSALPLAMPMGSHVEDLVEHEVFGSVIARRRRIDFRFDSYDVVAAYLGSADAVSLMPDWALAARADRLDPLAVPGFDERYRVVVAWPKRRVDPALIEAVLEEVRASFSSIAQHV